MPPPRDALRIVAAGALACLVAQGLGRFLLMPLLPAMQAAAGLDDAAAGLLASANFAGYLGGAVLTLLVPGAGRHGAAAGLALVVAGGLAMAGPPALWLPGRAAAGLGGALLFLAGTARAAGALERIGRQPLAGVMFAGVGVGIVAGGIVALALLPDWRSAWLWPSLAAACCWPLLAPPAAEETTPLRPVATGAAGSDKPALARPLLALSLAYAAAGLAFAAGTTFFVSAFAAGEPARATLAWIVAGATAAPSTLLWARLGRRLGSRAALAVAIALLALGTGLGALDASPATALAAGLLIGGTFMGVTALAMGRARELAPPGAGARAAGLVTVAFGLGQVAGPALSGHLLATAGPGPALLVPAGVALLGAAGLAADRSTGRPAMPT
jgi:MFS family permease